VLLMAASTRWLVRANLAAYLGATAVFCLVFNALTLVRTTDGWLFGNGLALLAISAIGMAWFVLAMRRPRSSGSRPSALALGEGPVRPVRSTAA